MGTNELRALPRTVRWRHVLALLDSAPFETSALAQALATATHRRLALLGNDEALGEAFWLLTRLTAASRAPGFVEALADLGFVVTPGTTAFALVADITTRSLAAASRSEDSGQFVELSGLALSAALTETVALQQPGLFGSSLHDLQDAFGAYATETRFGELAQRFFGDFVARTFAALVDREIANHIGGSSVITTIAESRDVKTTLETYARETARVVRDFAGQWFSKHDRQQEGDVTRAEAQAFVGHAVQKLRGAFAHAAASP